MQIESVLKKRALTVYFCGELDEYSAEQIRKRLDFKLDEGSFDTVIFDFANLTFMDSTGIGMIIGRYKRLSKRNIKIYIKNACVQVEKILRMTGIYEIMPKLSSEVI